MGTFAETAVVDYHLLFADQEKINFFFLLFLFSVYSKQMEVAVLC
jgi:hypothetical protein